jgi:hypothetical protein
VRVALLSASLERDPVNPQRSPLFAVFALLALAGPSLVAANGAPAPDASPPPPPAEWVITGTETCSQERLTVAQDIRVAAGAVLDLQGCILAVASPPYNDTYFASRDEGLTIRVDRGGLLRLHALPGRPAGIERADERYGYTIKAAGDVESIGLPETPNRIAGLEGAHESQLALGGFQVRGNATFRHTRFEENLGPGIFALGGARLDAERIDFVSFGGLMVSGATVRLKDWTAYARNSPVSLSRATVDFSDCSIRAGRLGMFVTQSNVTLRDCTVDSNGTALLMSDSEMRVSNVDMTYGTAFDALFGIGVQRKGSGLAIDPRLVLEDSSVLTDVPNATTALLAHQATVELRDTRLSASKGLVVNATFGRLTVAGGRLDGPQGVLATDPYAVEVVGAEGPSPLVTVVRNMVVRVRDGAGNGLPNVTLELGGGEGITRADGTGTVRWTFLEADEVPRLEYEKTVVLTVHDPETGRELEQDVKADSAYVDVTLRRGGLEWWPPSPALLGLAAVAAVLLAAFAWNKRRAKPGP